VVLKKKKLAPFPNLKMFQEHNYSWYVDYFSCTRNHIWTPQHKIASISSDHHKITTKWRYTLALELQVGHRMPVALWVFHEKHGDTGKWNM